MKLGQVACLIGALVLTPAAGCAGASELKVKTTDTRAGEIATRKTFSFAVAEKAPSGYAASEATPEVLEQVKQEIDANLRAKGYVASADESGELLVRISAGSREVVDSPSGSAARLGAPTTTDTQRAIVVDILDRTSKEVLFHGYARFKADAAPDPMKIREAVTSTLTSVPRAGAKP